MQALLTTRKGNKRFAVYDLNVTLTWEGLWVQEENKQVCNLVPPGVSCCIAARSRWDMCESVTDVAEAPCGVDLQITGEVVIGEFASANDSDEYEWTVTAEGSGDAQERLKQQMQTLQGLVYKKLQQYDQALNSLL